MVFSANAVETGPNNFENFRELAERINGTSAASASAPAATGNSSNRGSALSSSPAPIVTVGLLLLGLIGAWKNMLYLSRGPMEIAIVMFLLEGWRAAITVGTNDGPLTGLSNRYW